MRKAYLRPELFKESLEMHSVSIRTCRNADEKFMPTQWLGLIMR